MIAGLTTFDDIETKILTASSSEIVLSTIFFKRTLMGATEPVAFIALRKTSLHREKVNKIYVLTHRI